jgi:pimeloyl-ACP methyl ester carboxylesterase
MNVVVNNTMVHYTVNGVGPVVVLVHGWGDSLSTFHSMQTKLQKAYRVIALDLPGFGESEPPSETYDLQKYAQFVADFLHKITEKHIYAFIGHSNGGAIIIRGVSGGILHSDRVILLASSGIRSTYRRRKKALRIVAKTAKLPTKLLPSRTQTKLKKFAYKKVGSDLFVAEHLQETFKQVVTEDVLQDSAMIHQPTLLLYGSEDTATPTQYGELYAKQIENSKLVFVTDAEHFLHHTHAKEVEAEVLEFLKEGA